MKTKKKQDEKIEYSDTCPICKNKMCETDKKKDNITYYCRKCKQKYRIETVHKEQRCPHCYKIIPKEVLSNMHWNNSMNFYIRKVKVE